MSNGSISKSLILSAYHSSVMKTFAIHPFGSVEVSNTLLFTAITLLHNGTAECAFQFTEAQIWEPDKGRGEVSLHLS